MPCCIYYETLFILLDNYLPGKAGELAKHCIQLQMTKVIHLKAMTFNIQ